MWKLYKTLFCHYFVSKIPWNQFSPKEYILNRFDEKIHVIKYLVLTNGANVHVRTKCTFHTVENEKFTLTQKIFRQINSLVKPLLSRNFCQKCVRENSRNFHTVQCTFVEVTESYCHKNSVKLVFSLWSDLTKKTCVAFSTLRRAKKSTQ